MNCICRNFGPVEYRAVNPCCPEHGRHDYGMLGVCVRCGAPDPRWSSDPDWKARAEDAERALDEKLSVESADRWLAHRFNEVWERAEAAEAALADTRRALADAEQIARWFHESYERLAPMYGYKTRDESAVPWEQVPENNRKLMVATIRTVLALQPKRSAITVIQERLREGTAPSEAQA